MAYTAAQKAAAAKALQKYLPGLDYRVALAWVSAEQGANYNILGVVSNGHLVHYNSFDEGAKAAAARMYGIPSYYGGITHSLNGTAISQATAIARSPWHLGPAGLTRAGGTDPYYARIFAQFGFVIPSTGTGSDTGAPAGSGGSQHDPDKIDPGGALGAWGNIVSFPVGHIITQADVDDMMRKLAAAGFFGAHDRYNLIGAAAAQVTNNILKTAIGKPWTKALQDELQAKFFSAATEAVPKVPDVASVLGGVGSIVGAVVGVLAGLVLLAIGFWLYGRSNRQQIEVVGSPA